MKIFVDYTEPGSIVQELERRCAGSPVSIHRTLLHKRVGLGASAMEKHPLYGLGADYIITDEEFLPAVAIERKTFDDFAKTLAMLERGRPGARMFRQLADLRALPTPILILEGPPTPLYTKIEPQALGVHFWCIRQGISPLFTSGPRATAVALFQMARKLAREWDEPGAATEEPPENEAAEGVSSPPSRT